MRELNKISKNIFVLIFIMVIALVIAMTPFQKESAHALLPSSSNMRSSIDYSGQGTIINGKTTGDPAYTTTRSINGSNQQVVAVPIYQGGYKVKGLWSSRSDWKVKGASTNVTNRFATSSGVMYYYEFETKTQYEWERKGKKQWSFSRPVAVFPMYQKTGKTRAMYRYRTKDAVWDSELNKTVEYVPLNYSLTDGSNAYGIKWSYNQSISQFKGNFDSWGSYASVSCTQYYITAEQIKNILQPKMQEIMDEFAEYNLTINALLAVAPGLVGAVMQLSPWASFGASAVIGLASVYDSKMKSFQSLGANSLNAILTAAANDKMFVVIEIYHYASKTLGATYWTQLADAQIAPYTKNYVSIRYVDSPLHNNLPYASTTYGNIIYMKQSEVQGIGTAIKSSLQMKYPFLLPWNWFL